MNRLQSVFDGLKVKGAKALVPYISAGDPAPDLTVKLLHALVEGGADVLEIGVPFSDPVADGEVIQKANERALSRGVDLLVLLDMVRDFRKKDDKTPIVLMAYLNSFERRGIDGVFLLLKEAGVDAVLLVDCPFEALPDYRDALQTANLLPISLLAPTTQKERAQRILDQAEGFVYYVSLRGVTGKDEAQAEMIKDEVLRLKSQSDIPICVGFGIRDKKTACAMAEFADGVVIGSALVDRLWQAKQNGADVVECARAFVAEIRAALDAM